MCVLTLQKQLTPLLRLWHPFRKDYGFGQGVRARPWVYLGSGHERQIYRDTEISWRTTISSKSCFSWAKHCTIDCSCCAQRRSLQLSVCSKISSRTKYLKNYVSRVRIDSARVSRVHSNSQNAETGRWVRAIPTTQHAVSAAKSVIASFLRS